MMVAHAISGHVTGECFGVATVSVRGRLEADDPARSAVLQALAGRGPRTVVRHRRRSPLRRPERPRFGRSPRIRGAALRTPAASAIARCSCRRGRCWCGRRATASSANERGQYVDARTPGRSDQLPGVAPVGRLRRARMVGPLRYDARAAPGVQLYGIGRFNFYPRTEGGSCGDLGGPAGLVFSWETEVARRASISA
jgi:hypothetical protein